jgi:hypothetical protein
MMRNDSLRAEADRRAAMFFQAASSMSQRIRPTSLLNEIVGAADPDFALLNRFKTEVKRNPFVMLAAVGGLWLLAQQLKRREPPTKPVTRQGMRPPRLPRATLKGDENGYINDAKQH